MLEIIFICPGGVERSFADKAGDVLIAAVRLGL